MKKIFILLISLLCSIGSIWAQESETNTSLIITATKKFNQRFSAMGYVENRVYDFFSQQKIFIVGLEGGYRFVPSVKADLGYYCMVLRNKTRHRLITGVTGDMKRGAFTLSWRERFQYSFNPDEPILRSRVQGKYKIADTRLSPFTGIELHNDFSKAFAFNHVRYNFGCDYSLSKSSALSLSYSFRDYRKSANLHLFSLTYKLNL